MVKKRTMKERVQRGGGEQGKDRKTKGVEIQRPQMNQTHVGQTPFPGQPSIQKDISQSRKSK